MTPLRFSTVRLLGMLAGCGTLSTLTKLATGVGIEAGSQGDF
jgi:hypothetical protein